MFLVIVSIPGTNADFRHFLEIFAETIVAASIGDVPTNGPVSDVLLPLNSQHVRLRLPIARWTSNFERSIFAPLVPAIAERRGFQNCRFASPASSRDLQCA